MVTISIYGLDQYTVGHYSKDHTKNLANLLEVSEDNVSFYAPNAYVFHNGVEQTSWNAIVRVDAPKKLAVLQEDVARVIMQLVKGTTIHVQVVFNYFSQDNFYESINDDYPRYIEEKNIVEVDYDDSDVNIEEGEGDDQIFTGDIFKDFNR